MTLESGSPRKAQPKSAELVRKLVNQRTPEATSDNQPAPKITTEDGNLVRLPADPEEMNALQESNRVEINSNPPSRAEQYADRQALGLPISDTPLTTKEISKALAAMKRERAPRTLMNIENTDQVAQALEQAARRINDSEKAIKAYETSGSRSLTREHTTDSTRKQNPRGEVLAFAERPTEIIQRKNSVDETPTEFSVTVTPEQAREGASDEAPTVFMERTGTQILDETVEQKDIQETLNRHLEAQAQNETNDRLLRMEQLALSLGLTLSEELTDAQIDAAVQSLTQGMDDEDDNKYIAEEKAKRLKRYLNNINPERQASADALSEVQQMLNENKRENEAQTEDPIVRRDELLRSLGLDGRQLVTANDVVDQVRKLTKQKKGLTKEILTTQQEVTKQGRQLIDLLREYPVGQPEQLLGDAQKITITEAKKWSETENRPEEEDMVGYISPQMDADLNTQDIPETDTPVSEAEHPTLVPEIEEEAAETAKDAPKSNETTWESAEANDLKNAKKRLEEISAEVKELNGFLAELQQKEGVLARAARKLSEFMRIGQAPLPDGKVRTAAELKESETKITAVEDALNHNLQALERVQAKVERMTKKSVEQARLDLVKAQNAMEKASEQPKENGRESLQVRGLTAEELAASKKAAVEKFYAAVGMEIPVEQKSYIQNIAEMLGMAEDTLDGRLPTAKVGLRELNAARQEALFKKEEELKQESTGTQYAENQMVSFQEYLQQQGIDLKDPNVIAGLEQARQAFQNEAIQQKLSSLDLELRALMDEVIVHDKAETRLRILEQLGMTNTDKVNPNSIKTAFERRLKTVEDGTQRKELEGILKHNIRLLEKLEGQIAKLEKQNDPSEKAEPILIATESLEDPRVNATIENVNRWNNFDKLPSLAEKRKNQKEWWTMLLDSETINSILDLISTELHKTKTEIPKDADATEIDPLNDTKIFQDSNAPERDRLNILQRLHAAGPDPQKIHTAVKDIRNQLAMFLHPDIIKTVQPQLENELIKIYNRMAQGEAIAGDTLSDPAQLTAWEMAIKKGGVIDEQITTLAEKMSKGTKGNDPEWIRDQLLIEASPAQIMQLEARLQRMIQLSDGPKDNRPAAEKELKKFMRAVNAVYKQASSPDTRMAA